MTIASSLILVWSVGCPEPDPGGDDETNSGDDETNSDGSETGIDGETGDGDEGAACDPDCGEGCPLRVDADAPPGGTGTSWATAFDTVQAAIDCSSPGQVIWIAAGDYPGVDASPVAEIPHRLELYGGFAGTESSLDERQLGMFETTLGPATESVVITEPDVVLDGLTIRGGQAEFGGGILVEAPPNFQDGLVELRSLRLLDNVASDSGGAIGQPFSSSIRLEECELVGNSAAVNGAAIWTNDGAVTIHDSRIEANLGAAALANNAYGYSGFSVHDSEVIDNEGRAIAGARIRVERSRVEGNLGGGIAAINWARVIDSVVVDNMAEVGGGLTGGGMLTHLEVRGSVFSGNHATVQGGAISVGADASLSVHESRLLANTTDGRGGGVASPDGWAVIEDTEFVANEAALAGGGVFGSATIRRSTFSGNLADNQPNAVSDFAGYYEPVIEASVLWPDGAWLVDVADPPDEDERLVIIASCVPEGMDPQHVALGVDVLMLADSPFELADLDDDGRIEHYLEPGSGCVDRVVMPGDVEFDWQATTTQAAQCTDVPPLDAGVHYRPLIDPDPC